MEALEIFDFPPLSPPPAPPRHLLEEINGLVDDAEALAGVDDAGAMAALDAADQNIGIFDQIMIADEEINQLIQQFREAE